MTVTTEVGSVTIEDAAGEDAVDEDAVGDQATVSEDAAQALAGRVMAAAGDLAKSEASFLDLVGEFDASGAIRWFGDLGTVPRWLAWACSIAPVTAREHVRVARALRRMPVVRRTYQAGELTYSKVRELTRLVGECEDEEGLVRLARAATADQLARTVRAFRGLPGTQAEREPRERVSWSHDDHGMVRISVVLTPERGQAVIAALEAAADDCLPETGSPEHPAAGPELRAEGALPLGETEDPEQVRRRAKADGLVAMANHYLASQPEDRSGEDRYMVVVDVNAAQLAAGAGEGVPAGTPGLADPTPATGAEPAGDAEPAGVGDRNGGGGVPAGTPPPVPTAAESLRDGTCRVRGGPALEPATARRLSCEALIAGVLRDEVGEPLAVGRSVRFGTRAQRRALHVRDGHCQYPGCVRSRRLKIHHIVSWLDGGPTDLDNMILLCQRHHTAVHEGGVRIGCCAADSGAAAARECPVRWHFHRRDGSEIVPEDRRHHGCVDDRAPGVTGPTWPGRDGVDGTGAVPNGVDGTGPVPNGVDGPGSAPDTPGSGAVASGNAGWVHPADRYRHVTCTTDPEALGVFPVGGGEFFVLANCVDALFAFRTRKPRCGTVSDHAA